MILYISNCPIHIQKKLTIKNTELVTRTLKDGTTKKVPIFYCEQCRAYYLYTANTEKHLNRCAKTYKDLPVFFSNEKYRLIREGDQDPEEERYGRAGGWKNVRTSQRAGASASIWKNTAGSSGSKSGRITNRGTVQHKVDDPIVRIHIFSNEEMDTGK